MRNQSVKSCRHRRPLCMSLTNSLLTKQLHFYLLPRSELSYQYVLINRSNRFCILWILIPYWDPLKIARKHTMILIQRILINWTKLSFLPFSQFPLPCTLHMKLILQWILLIIRITRLLILKILRISFNWNQPHSMSKYLVSYHAQILPDSDFLNGYGGHLWYHYPS